MKNLFFLFLDKIEIIYSNQNPLIDTSGYFVNNKYN